MDKARLEIKGVGTAGANGLAIKVMLTGLETENAPGVPAAAPVRVRVLLSVNAGACESYESPMLTVRAGKLKGAFTAGELAPNFAEQRGVLRFCGAGVRLEDSDELFAVDGMILRHDPD